MTLITSKNTKDSPTTTNIYPYIIYKETSKLSLDFGIKIDEKCKAIFDECKGLRSHNNILIVIISSLTQEQRHKISIRYNEIYNQSLPYILKQKCVNTSYGIAMELLSLSPPDAESLLIRRVTHGLFTNKLILFSIICGRSNEDINILKNTYFNMYTEDLISRVNSKVSGNLRKLLISCLQGIENNFDSSYHTEEQAFYDAVELFKGGHTKIHRSEIYKLFKLIVVSPPKYLDMVSLTISEEYGYTLYKIFEKNFRGITKYASLFMLGMKLKPYETVAHLIKKSCKRVGSNQLLLTSCIVRYTAILSHINLAHIELFGKSIHDRVKDRCSGNQRKLLISLLNNIIPNDF